MFSNQNNNNKNPINFDQHQQFLNRWSSSIQCIPKSLFIYLFRFCRFWCYVNRSRKCFNDDDDDDGQRLIDWSIKINSFPKMDFWFNSTNFIIMMMIGLHAKTFRKIFVKHIDIFSDFFGFGRGYVSLWLSVRVQKKNKVDWLIFIQSKKIQNENFGFWCDDDDHFSN